MELPSGNVQTIDIFVVLELCNFLNLVQGVHVGSAQCLAINLLFYLVVGSLPTQTMFH